MDEQYLKTLLAEYAALSSFLDKYTAFGYSILPLALTGIGGAMVFGQFKGEYAGLGTSLLLLLAIAWVGTSHTLLNRIGLRLIAIELRVRDELSIDTREEPFFTSFIGQGAPGLFVYFSFFALVASAVLCVSMVNWWTTLTAWKCSMSIHVAGVSIPVVLNVIGVLTLYVVERDVNRKRTALVEGARRAACSLLVAEVNQPPNRK